VGRGKVERCVSRGEGGQEKREKEGQYKASSLTLNIKKTGVGKGGEGNAKIWDWGKN